MAEEIAFENGQFSNFEGLMSLTLTLDGVILHTDVHHPHDVVEMGKCPGPRRGPWQW